MSIDEEGEAPLASQSAPLRIGILCNKGSLEAGKCELVSTRRRKHARAWLKGIDQKHVEKRSKDALEGIESRWNAETGVPVDQAAGLYVKHTFGDRVHVDFIFAKDVSPERLATNDLNFLMLYDDLEAFHTDRSPGKAIYHKTVHTLSTANNVFPPRDYQEFVNSKINYYTHLRSNGITICPTICLKKEEYCKRVDKTSHQGAVETLMAKIEKKGWDAIFCKPVFGIESRDAKMFKFISEHQKKRFGKYLKKIFEKYPGLVIQKYLEGFGDELDSPEVRCIHIGEDYQYAVQQTDSKNYRPKCEGGTRTDLPMPLLKDFAKKVMGVLPEIVVQGVKLPRLITRLDLGFKMHGRDSEPNPFVNEVEYCPSLYVENVHHHYIEKVVGDQMVVITQKLVDGLKGL